MQDYKNRFFKLALRKGNLRFGSFTLKSGRISPYFFNAGGFDDGASLSELAACYADTIIGSGIAYDMLFGPAYKGIPLVTATATALADGHDTDVPWAYNRKEAKDHGEGGHIVGAPLAGAVMIVDDVITAGTAIRESKVLIDAAGARPAGVLIALDRQERGQGERSAVQEVEAAMGVPVISIIGLDDLITHLGTDARFASAIASVSAYRDRYGV